MDFALGCIEASAFAFCSYTFYRCQKKQLRFQDLISFVQQATPLTPSALRKAMETNGSEQLLRNIKEYEEGRNYSKGIAFVSGVVEGDQVIRSILNHSTKLVLSSVSSELIFSNNKNFEESDGRIDTKYVSEFKLSDPVFSQKESVVLNSASNIQFGDALHLIHSIVHMRSLSPLEKFLSWVLFCIKLFLSMSNVGKKLSGFKVGTKRVERGIMIGQMLVAFGEVIYDKYNKELRMSNPFSFHKDKEQLIYRLKEKRVTLGRNMTLLFMVMVMLGFILAKRLTKVGKTLFQKYKKLQAMKSLDQFYKINKLTATDFRCSLCGDNVRNVIFKPCLHLVTCHNCYEKLSEKKCPTCKRQIEDVVNIFVV